MNGNPPYHHAQTHNSRPRHILPLLAAAAGAPSGKAADLPWLQAQDCNLVDSSGHPVALRGVALGGWLVEEMWMQPIVTSPPAGSHLSRVEDHVSLWRVVEQRLGKAAMEQCRASLRASWINESDVERLHRAGLNSVRLPFLYDLLDKPDGFDWLDKALDWCSRRDMYVILDMHGLPGGQSNDHHTGQANQNRFFREARYVEQAEARVAENRPAISRSCGGRRL